MSLHGKVSTIRIVSLVALLTRTHSFYKHYHVQPIFMHMIKLVGMCNLYSVKRRCNTINYIAAIYDHKLLNQTLTMYDMNHVFTKQFEATIKLE